eukprot:GILI01058075.1.p1 GENE.GILI01058075.1~~GILI01058075.1.p1  ORF type:complete len:204 (-),score=20.52 GILI01058075.1:33-584(-)
MAQRPQHVKEADWKLFENELKRFQGANAMTAAQLANARAEDLGNSQDMERHWAETAFRHAEVYFRLISTADQSRLRLTKIDNEIYRHFRNSFPEMKLDLIEEDRLKSESSKRKWREFCNAYNGERVKDFNFLTLLRLDASKDYSEENCTVVPRIQFLAIEIARNLEGVNRAVQPQPVEPVASE